MTDVEEAEDKAGADANASGADASTDEARSQPEAKSDEATPPRRKKKKKRKKKEPAAEARPARNAHGRDRPTFLLSFPHDPELDRLIAAFEAGDYARVRREAPELAEQTEDRAVRDAALELRRRIDPDPLARYLLLAGIGLLVFLVIWVYAAHGR